MPIVVTDVARVPESVIDQFAKLGVATVHESQGRRGLMAARLRPIYRPARAAGTAARGARLAHRRLFRGRGSGTTVRLPVRVADGDRGGSHGPPDVSKHPDGPEFGAFLRLMRENESVWCKVTCPERLSRLGPPDYADVVPFARRVVEEFPDRVLWGTDWPHPNMRSHTPDDGKLVDLIPAIAPTEALQQKLLVDNPMRLYWPEEVV